MAENITKKQHFVPKFYLKRFAKIDNFIEVLDLDKRELLKPYPYGGVCYGEYFYAADTGKPDKISQDLEKALKQIEDVIAPKLDSIMESIVSTRKIDDEELSILSSFMSMLWVRGTYMRKQTQRSAVDVAKQSMAIIASHKVNFPRWMERIMKENNVDVTEKDIEEVRQALVEQDYNLEFNNILHLNMMKDMDIYAEIFFDKKWRFYIAGGDSNFITSDTPTIEWFPEWKGFYGPDIFQRKHYLALTPKILIELSHPKGHGKRIKREMITNEKVLEYNMIIANYSDKYCYSKSRDELQILSDLIKLAKAKFLSNLKSAR